MKLTVAIAAILSLGLVFAQEPTHSVWDGIYTDAQAKRGTGAYSQYCASCHGDQMTGGEMAPPLAGGEFLSNWNGLTVGDLFDRIYTTMPANKPKSVSREVNADILAYIFAMNKFPAGSTEMAHQTEVLKQFKIDASKPDKK